MLVLARRKGESILIGEDIEICILGHNEKQVNVGVRAPKEVKVDREEVRARQRGERGPRRRKVPNA